MDYNVVVLAGRLAAPPELREFESGNRFMRYLVTVRATEPRRRIDVVPVTEWDPPQDHVDFHAQAGQRVFVSGSVQRRFWEAEGGRRSRLEIVAHQVCLREEPEAQDEDAEDARRPDEPAEAAQ